MASTLRNRPGILKDDRLDQELFEKGFSIFPFLDPGQVERLRKCFAELHPDGAPEGTYATVHAAAPEVSLKVSRLLAETCHTALQNAFRSCIFLGGVYFSKSHGPKGLLPPHQDWNIVDEQYSRSFNVWVPLVDTTAENGAIQVIPGSHRWMDTIRGVNIPSAFEKVVPLAWKYMQTIPMKAGSAMIYDHALMHASGENHTQELRLTIVLAIAPEGAKIKYYYMRDGRIERFAADANFYLTGNPPEGPGSLASEGFVDYRFPEVSEAKFRALNGDQAAS